MCTGFGLILLTILCASVGGAESACKHVKNDDMIEYSCAGGEPTDLYDLPETTGKIRITNMPISRITADTFSKFGSNLWVLSCSHCDIVDIEPGAFRHLDNLQQLSLDSNYLTVVKASWFTGLNYLTFLDLNYNKIRTIEDGVFENLPSLVDLRLSGNQFECLNIDDLSRSKELKRIFLGENSEFKCPNAVSNFLETRGVTFERDPKWDKIPNDLVSVHAPFNYNTQDRRTSSTPSSWTPTYREKFYTVPASTAPEQPKTSYVSSRIYPPTETILYTPEYATSDWRTTSESTPPTPNYYERYPVRPTTQRLDYERYPVQPSTQRSDYERYPVQPSSESSDYERYPVQPSTQRSDYERYPVQPSTQSSDYERYPVQPSTQRLDFERYPAQPMTERSDYERYPVQSTTERLGYERHPVQLTTLRTTYERYPEQSTILPQNYERYPVEQPTLRSNYEDTRMPHVPPGITPPVDITTHPTHITSYHNADITTMRSRPSVTESGIAAGSESALYPPHENENKHHEQTAYSSEVTGSPSLAPSPVDHQEAAVFVEPNVDRTNDPYKTYWIPDNNEAFSGMRYPSPDEPTEVSPSAPEVPRTDSTRVVRPIPPAGPELIQPASPGDFFQVPYNEPTVTIRPPSFRTYQQQHTETTMGVLSIEETTTDKPLPECPTRNSASAYLRSFRMVVISVLLIVMKNVVVEGY